MIPIDDNEWQAAEQLNESNAAKLPRTQNPDGSTRPRYQKEFEHYQTRHTLFRFQQHTFAVERHEHARQFFKGRGTFAVVKPMHSQRGATAVVKRFLSSRDPADECMYARKRDRESRITQDLGLSYGMLSYQSPYKASQQKHYLHMQDLGDSLLNVLTSSHSLTDAKRLDMAISACLAVADLHEFARRSRTRTRYAHCDIKPANFTIDASGNVHLVDFGAAKTRPQSILRVSNGTRIFAPPPGFNLEKWKYDVLALKRCLLFPSKFRCHDGVQQMSGDFCTSISILTPELVQQYGLDSFIDTSISARSYGSDFMQDNTTALCLAAILIAARRKLDLTPDLLAKNSYLCLLIVDLYQEGFSPDAMATRLNEVHSPQQQALNINRIRGLGLDAASITAPGPLADLINILEQRGLIHHIHKISSHAALSQRLLSSQDTSHFYRQLNWFLEEIPDNSEHLERLINAYLDQSPLTDLMIRRQITRAFHATILSEEQLAFLIHCDRQHWCNTQGRPSRVYHHALPRVVLDPAMLTIMQAVLKATPTRLQHWLEYVTFNNRMDIAQCFEQAARLLQEKDADSDEFETIFSTLAGAIKDITRLQAIVILMKNGLPGHALENRLEDKHARAELALHLDKANLQAYLPALLAFTGDQIRTLNCLVSGDFKQALPDILADASLMERLKFDQQAKSIFIIRAAEYLNKIPYPFDSLSYEQAGEVLKLPPHTRLPPEELRQKIDQILSTAQSNNPFEGLVSYLKASSIPEPCSSFSAAPGN